MLSIVQTVQCTFGNSDSFPDDFPSIGSGLSVKKKLQKSRTVPVVLYNRSFPH